MTIKRNSGPESDPLSDPRVCAPPPLHAHTHTHTHTSQPSKGSLICKLFQLVSHLSSFPSLNPLSLPPSLPGIAGDVNCSLRTDHFESRYFRNLIFSSSLHLVDWSMRSMHVMSEAVALLGVPLNNLTTLCFSMRSY